MIRRPPRSTLFPTRRSSDLESPAAAVCAAGSELAMPTPAMAASGFFASSARSEEHTSELQSQSNLVCRLLLEKQKHLHQRRLLPLDQLRHWPRRTVRMPARQ